MALTNAQYTVAEGTRVRIASADNMPQDVIVHDGAPLDGEVAHRVSQAQ